ncbi:MAG: glycosyltransferase [Acidobacteriota bacterium]|nr:glycosyltransferase [Acidobacteriota bacterium]
MISQGIAIGTLYICYFGMREPLVQTQVLPYLRLLAVAGVKVHLLTFEPRIREQWSEAALANEREQLMTEGISWFCLPYHKSPSVVATLYDITAGARFVVRLARQKGINVLHARAHVPMAMALWAQRFVRVKVIFDIRGLMAEEYADAGIWTEHSLPFRLVKTVERLGIRRADQIIVLTSRLRDWLLTHKLKAAEQIEVIPCCVDFARFNESYAKPGGAGARSLAADRFEVVYAGSLTGLYLAEEMGRFFKAIKKRRPNAFLRILSLSPPDQGAVALKRAGLEEKDFVIGAVPPGEVPAYLRRATLGVSFRKSSFAQIAASPTKIPEYLAVGLPVVCNAGIGDMDKLVEEERVGVVLRTFDDDAFEQAATRALLLAEASEVRARCRRVARSRFDLQTVGGQRYVDVYRRLAGQLQGSK